MLSSLNWIEQELVFNVVWKNILNSKLKLQELNNRVLLLLNECLFGEGYNEG